ncbi:MAG: peptidoglycan-binding protein [Bdellovibrionales bacterium]|nr:peptidoglycan-binding protein [Bdellovibrionales bacterium]
MAEVAAVGTIDIASELSTGLSPTVIAVEEDPRVQGTPALDKVRSGEIVLRSNSPHTESVRELQRSLRELGYDIKVDGAFGKNTANAVREFQRSQGLTVDGVVGKKTLAAIDAGLASDVLKQLERKQDQPVPPRESSPTVQGTEAVRETNLDAENFRAAMKHVFRFEGGINSDPDDIGNRGGNVTNLGITQSVYNSWRAKHDLPNRSTLEITKKEAAHLYKEEYWDRAHCPNLPEKSSLVQFDTAVNMGVGGATLLLQKTINQFLPPDERISVDGAFGPKTERALAAVLERTSDKDLALRYLENREEKYRQLATVGANEKFLRGWLNRIDALEKVIAPQFPPVLSASVRTGGYDGSTATAVRNLYRELGIDEPSTEITPAVFRFLERR